MWAGQGCSGSNFNGGFVMKKFIFALATAGAALAALPAQAAVVDFEDQAAFRCDFTPGTSGAFKFSNSFALCYYSAANPADFPTPITSTVMASGYTPTVFSMISGDTFSLNSVDLAFGPFRHGGLESDDTLVTALLGDGTSISTTLTVGYGFKTYNLGWNNVKQLTFGTLQKSSEYLAFDNLVYNAGNAGVPEPASWALMLAGFGLVGASMRRRGTGVPSAA